MSDENSRRGPSDIESSLVKETKKSFIHISYNEGLIDSFPNNDKFFETYLIFGHNKFSKNVEKTLKKGGRF